MRQIQEADIKKSILAWKTKRSLFPLSRHNSVQVSAISIPDFSDWRRQSFDCLSMELASRFHLERDWDEIWKITDKLKYLLNILFGDPMGYNRTVGNVISKERWILFEYLFVFDDTWEWKGFLTTKKMDLKSCITPLIEVMRFFS